MHPAHRLAESEAATTTGVIAGGEILNTEAAEVAALVPVISRKTFGAAVADAQADERVGFHRLEPRSEGERSTTEASYRTHMWFQTSPVRSPEKCIALFAVQQQQVEIDRCPLRPDPLIAAVLADLSYECLEKGPALLTTS